MALRKSGTFEVQEQRASCCDTIVKHEEQLNGVGGIAGLVVSHEAKLNQFLGGLGLMKWILAFLGVNLIMSILSVFKIVK